MQSLAENEVYEIYVGDATGMLDVERLEPRDETAIKFVEHFLTSESLAESGLILTKLDDHNYMVTPESTIG